MLAYLIAISILNILLGYALAVYLMRASLSAEFTQRSIDASKRSPQSPASGEGSHSASATGGSVFPQGTSHGVRDAQAAPATAATMATTTPAGASVAEISRRSSEETDAQLLAGIADFRSQLAKLRSSAPLEQGEFASSER